MHSYGVRDVEKLLRLPRNTIRSLIADGFVTPARGPRNALLFLVPRPDRAARRAGVGAANIPHRRIPAGAARTARDCRRRCRYVGGLSNLAPSRIHVVRSRRPTETARPGGFQAQYGAAVRRRSSRGLAACHQRPVPPSPSIQADADGGTAQHLAHPMTTKRAVARLTERAKPEIDPSRIGPPAATLGPACCCTNWVRFGGRRHRLPRRDRCRPWPRTRCCSTTSASCSTTWDR
jgi:hypothetical protein